MIFPDEEIETDDVFLPTVIVPDEEFVADVFVPTKDIERMSSVPRFGRLSNIGFAASANTDIQRDYVIGVLFVSSLILLVFVVWIAVLLIFNSLGSQQVGCASGDRFSVHSLNQIRSRNRRRFQRMEGHTEEELHEADVRQWTLEASIVVRRAKRVRIVFIASGLGLIAASVFLCLSGLDVLESAYNTIQVKVNDMGDSISSATSKVSILLSESTEIRPWKDLLSRALSDVDGWCPNAVNGSIPGAENTVNVTNSTINFVDSLNKLDHMGIPGTMGLEAALFEAQRTQDDIASDLTSLDWWWIFIVVFVSLLMVLTIIFLAGVTLSLNEWQREWFRRFQTKAFFLFALLINVTWVVTSGFALVAVLTADICTGSPEQNLMSIFQEKEYEMRPLLFEMTKYYILGCSAEERPDKPADFLYQYGEYLERARMEAVDLLAPFAGMDSSEMIDTCGSTNANNALGNVSSIFSSFQGLSDLNEAAIESLYCSNFNPHATEIFHQAICHDGVTGLSVTFGMLLAIVVFGMIMITLRVSWQQIEGDRPGVREVKREVKRQSTLRPNDPVLTRLPSILAELLEDDDEDSDEEVQDIELNQRASSLRKRKVTVDENNEGGNEHVSFAESAVP